MDIKYEVPVKKSFELAIKDLKTSLINRKFGVLWELNFKDKLNEKGLDFKKNFKILEVCNPPQAKNVLEKNLEVGYFLPCKIVVYEQNNQVFVGMIRPTKFIDMMNNEELTNIAVEVERELINAIDEII